MSPQAKAGQIVIFGWPLRHTLSPRFQNAGLKALGLKAIYEALPVLPKDFSPRARRLMLKPEFLGANVTIPHKVAAARLVDRLSPEAKSIGAVNTLYRKGRLWMGDNTDAQGFLMALKSKAGFSPRGKAVAILGVGGSARAVAWACLKAGASKILLGCRRPEKGRALIRHFGVKARRFGLCNLEASGLESLLEGSRLLVNTVPGAGFAAKAARALMKVEGAPELVFDISYANPGNALLKAARKRKAKALDGLPMLLEQGLLSFKRFTGRAAPRKAMAQALGLS